MKKIASFIFIILLTFLIPSIVLSAEKKVTSRTKKEKISKKQTSNQEKNIINHKVRKGDTPAKISRQYGVSLEEILKVNEGINPKNLKVGSIIKVPLKQSAKLTKNNPQEKTVYVVKKGDTLYSISKKFSISIDEIKKLNNIKDNTLTAGTQLVLKKDYLVYKPKNKKEINYTLRDEVDEDDGESEEGEEVDLQIAEREKDLNIENRSIDYENIKYTLTDNDVNKLIASALDYLGASYKYGGNQPASIDCSAFVKRVFNEVKIPLPRTSREQYELGVEVPLNQLSEGDLLFFTRKKRIGHVGIYIGDDKFIHAAGKGKGVIISSMNTPYFKKTFVGAKRIFIKESDKASLNGKKLSLAEKPLIN
ncbi:MAG: NlpC/P60 family protein [Proteobacteria bacterium]|nr:NlpC/P60 family protein [Pseudomonadota bacterium]